MSINMFLLVFIVRKVNQNYYLFPLSLSLSLPFSLSLSLPLLSPSPPSLPPSPPSLSPSLPPSDDYYDTEDPSVNLHDFIMNSLQAQKCVTRPAIKHSYAYLPIVHPLTHSPYSATHPPTNSRVLSPYPFTHTVHVVSYSYRLLRNRVILLQLEEEFLSYVRDPTR